MRKPQTSDENAVANVSTFCANLRREIAGDMPRFLSATVRATVGKVQQGDSHRFVVAMFTDCFAAIMLQVVREQWQDTDANHAILSLPRPRSVSVRSDKALTLVEQRALKAQESLKRWQRKQKLAQTKIRKYAKQVRYYKKKGTIQ